MTAMTTLLWGLLGRTGELGLYISTLAGKCHFCWIMVSEKMK